MDRDAKSKYAQALVALLNAPPRSETSSGDAIPWEMTLTREARFCLDDFEEWLEPTLRTGNENEPIRDWASKAPGRALRIAAILESAQRAGDGGSFNLGGSLPGWAMEAGVALVKCGLSHARIVMGGTNPETLALEKILSACIELCRASGGETTTREVHQKLKNGSGGRFRYKYDMTPFLAKLQERGLVQSWSPPAREGGGRRPELLRVHPTLLEDKPQNPPRPSNTPRPSKPQEVGELEDLDDTAFLDEIRGGE
jgi:hypothetical protein